MARLPALADEQVGFVFEALLGYPPRVTDVALLRALGPAGPTLADLAHFVHDHHLGEPDTPSPEQVLAAVRAALAGTDPCA